MRQLSFQWDFFEILPELSPIKISVNYSLSSSLVPWGLKPNPKCTTVLKSYIFHPNCLIFVNMCGGKRQSREGPSGQLSSVFPLPPLLRSVSADSRPTAVFTTAQPPNYRNLRAFANYFPDQFFRRQCCILQVVSSVFTLPGNLSCDPVAFIEVMQIIAISKCLV